MNPADNKERCLIAMPGLEGSYFEKTVIYMIDHTDEGALGLIINKPIEVSVDEILKQINTDYNNHLYPEPIYVGGPVDNHRGFVLHRPSNTDTWEQQITLNHSLAITTSADILMAMSHEQSVGEYQIIIGYSGWSAGQLEEEMAGNSWLSVDIDITSLLQLPSSKRLDAALAQLGIQYSQLSTASGHS